MGAIAMAFATEVGGASLERAGLLSDVSAELFSMLALALLCGAGIYLMFRLPNRPALKTSIVLASGLTMFSQTLATTGRLSVLNNEILFGATMPFHDIAQDLSLLSGLVIMLVVAFLALIEAVASEQELAIERSDLAQEVEERKRAESALEQSREELRSLGLHIETAREEERKRLAREIHDELGQSLTILSLDLSSLENELQPISTESTSRLISSMATAISGTMYSVREIISELRPGILDELGLVPAAEWQAREFERRSGIHIQFRVTGAELAVSPEKATALFRILQEALTNVARHSRASEVSVNLAFDAAQVQLTVEDNGQGISEKNVQKKPSFGLLGVRERVRPFGGSVNITSSKDGTQIKISLPNT